MPLSSGCEHAERDLYFLRSGNVARKDSVTKAMDVMMQPIKPRTPMPAA